MYMGTLSQLSYWIFVLVQGPEYYFTNFGRILRSGCTDTVLGVEIALTCPIPMLLLPCRTAKGLERYAWNIGGGCQTEALASEPQRPSQRLSEVGTFLTSLSNVSSISLQPLGCFKMHKQGWDGASEGYLDSQNCICTVSSQNSSEIREIILWLLYQYEYALGELGQCTHIHLYTGWTSLE